MMNLKINIKIEDNGMGACDWVAYLSTQNGEKYITHKNLEVPINHNEIIEQLIKQGYLNPEKEDVSIDIKFENTTTTKQIFKANK